jgi:cytochrome c oxidase cbb3-type subunit 3
MADNTHLEIDPATGTATTGHEWDGIKELNTPLPKWWLYLFYACIVWALGYWVVYPAIPLASGFTSGVWNWSSRGAVNQEVAELQATRAKALAGFDKLTLQQIASDPKTSALARSYGRSAFGNNCAPCHGSGGQGAKGYPNLTGDRWLWGGTLDQISATITHGARSGDAAGHDPDSAAVMPAWSKMGLNAKQISDVADYVLSLTQATKADVSAGKKIFADNCVACHGDNATGNQELGAPNLTSKAKWLYGSDKATLVETITNGRGGHMPAWGGKLDDVTIKAVTVFVHSLGGGQ